MKKIGIMLAVMLAFASCRVQRQETTIRQSDSVNTKYIVSYRDTTLSVSIREQALEGLKIVNVVNGTVNSDTSVLKTDHSVSTAYVLNGLLFHNIKTINESFDATVKNGVKEVTVSTEKRSSIDKKTVEIKEVNRLYWWQKSLIFVGIISLIFGIWYLYKNLRRIFFL